MVAKDIFLSPNFAFLYFPGMRAPVWAHGGCVGCEVDILTKTWRAMQAPAAAWPSGNGWQLHGLHEPFLQCMDAWDLTCDKKSSEAIGVAPKML